ncbi:MAG: hypothetical protein ACYDCT_11940, partial [Dehalococcoidia bacterium]
MHLPLTATEDRLRKVLELERKMRCGDRAVTAGLDVFLTNIKVHEAPQLASDVFARIQILPGSGYRSLSPVKRRQWIEGTLAVLKAGPNGATPPARRTVTAVRTVAAAAPAARPVQRPLAPGTPKLTAEEAARLGVDAPVHALKRVPFALAVKFDKLGVHTVRDLLLLFPRRHADYGDPVPVAHLEFGREQTVRAHVWSAKERQFGFRMRATEATIGDATGMMSCVWFNQPWIAKQLPTNAEIVVSGRVSEHQGRPKFDNPEWELWSSDLLHTGRLVPVYPLTAGLPNRTVRRVMREA